MKKYYFLSIILFFGLLSCSNEETKTKTETASRPSVPVMDNSVVTIGNQVWMTKNLEVTTYRDGTPIPEAPWSNISSTGLWCYYNNAQANGVIYGKNYSWYAVAGIYDAASLANPVLRKNLAPAGWHIPTKAEWATLISYLGGQNVAGGKLKEAGTSHWRSPNVGATNSSGFNGLPSGLRHPGGSDSNLTSSGSWWSKTEDGEYKAWYPSLYYGDGQIIMSSVDKDYGMAVRCIKD